MWKVVGRVVAVDTVLYAPDDGWWYHPKHVEQFPDKINCVTIFTFAPCMLLYLFYSNQLIHSFLSSQPNIPQTSTSGTHTHRQHTATYQINNLTTQTSTEVVTALSTKDGPLKMVIQL